MNQLRRQAHDALANYLRRARGVGPKSSTLAAVVSDIYEPVVQELVDVLEHEIGNRERETDPSREVLDRVKALLNPHEHEWGPWKDSASSQLPYRECGCGEIQWD